VPHHDLVVLGAGSGNNVVDARPGWDVAVVEHGPFGGTCLNAGCIPTKMLAHTADVADAVRAAGTFGLDARVDAVRWAAVQDRIFGRLDHRSREGRAGRVDADRVTVYDGHARFTGKRTLSVERTDGSGRDEITADHVVVAAGGRPVVPEPVAASGVPFETSDTIMRRARLPRRLAVLGGGYIAAEFAHIFSALGAEIVMIDMADRLLGPQDETVAERYTALARERYDVRLGRQVEAVTGREGAVRLTLDDGSVVDADTLLVAVGRTPNGDRLDLDAAGIERHPDGRIVVDAQQRTTADGVFALGDVSTSVPLKHVANREAEVVSHNLRHPDDPVETDLSAVPAGIFTDPQIATVGRTGQQCRDEGIDHVQSVQPYSDTAYGWALEDTTGFCKVLAERGSGRLLGAHIMGPQAATLIQPLVVALSCGIDATTLARTPFWIHPALTEVVENALLGLDV
jgi:mycothione reductase